MSAKPRVIAKKDRIPNQDYSRYYYFWWFALCFNVLACLPNMMSSDYLPKTIVTAAVLGLGYLLLRVRKNPALSLSHLGFAFIVYGTWILLSLAWSLQPMVGFERFIALILLPATAYLFAKRLRFWESDKFWVLFSTLFAFVCLIGCLQFVPSERLPGILKSIYNVVFLPFSWIPSTGLPSSTLGNRNYAGLYLVVTFPFIAWHYFHAKGPKTNLLSLGALMLGVAFLIFSRERMGWISLAAGFIYLLIAGMGKMALQDRRRIAILGGILVLVVAAGLAIGPSRLARSTGFSRLPAYKEGVVQTLATIVSDSTTNKRWAMWKHALSINASPYLGCGYGSFPIAASPFNPLPHSLNWEVHNDYLQNYVDLGIPGIFFYLLLIGLILRLAWKGRKDPLAAAAGAAFLGLILMLSLTFISEKVATITWAAGIIALLNDRQGANVFVRPITAIRARLLFSLLGILLLTLAFCATQSAIGDRKFWQANDRYVELTKNGQTGVLQQETNILARQVLPTMWFDSNMIHVNCHVWGPRALFAGDPQGAFIFAERAQKLQPNDWKSLRVLAELAIESKKWPAAINYLETAVEISNDKAPVLKRLIYCYEQAGIPHKAKAAQKKLDELGVTSSTARTGN